MVVGQPFDLLPAQDVNRAATNKKQPVIAIIFFINFNVDINVFCTIVTKDRVSTQNDATNEVKINLF